MINEPMEKFKGDVQDFFMNEERNLAEAERDFRERLNGIVTGLLSTAPYRRDQ